MRTRARTYVQEAALKAALQVDSVAASIGAVNTLIRGQDGSFKVCFIWWMFSRGCTIDVC